MRTVLSYSLLVVILSFPGFARALQLKTSLSAQGSFGGAPVAAVSNPDDSMNVIRSGNGVGLLFGLTSTPLARWKNLRFRGILKGGYKFWRAKGDASGALVLHRWPVELLLNINHKRWPILFEMGLSLGLFTSVTSSFDTKVSSFIARPTVGLPIYLHYKIKPWLLGGLRFELGTFKNSVDQTSIDATNVGLNFRFLF